MLSDFSFVSELSFIEFFACCDDIFLLCQSDLMILVGLALKLKF